MAMKTTRGWARAGGFDLILLDYTYGDGTDEGLCRLIRRPEPPDANPVLLVR